MLRLEPKELFDTGEVQLPRHRAAERIGPYTVLREVARAPGARLVEAEGPGEARVLLQVVRLRAPADEADRVARQRYERGLGARTAALFDELDLEIRAQGGADLSDGTRWIYWARAWSGAPVDAGALTSDDLVVVARDLLERLARRHGLGRTEPLLGEHTLWRAAGGRYSVAGVPVGVDAAWMAPSEERPLRAPDEAADGDARGDLWRLGQALRALSAGREITPPLREVIDALGEDLVATDSAIPRPRASSADVALRALGADPESMPTGPTPVVAAPAASWADAVPPASTTPAPASPPARNDALDAATTRIELVPPPAPLAALVRAPFDSAEMATVEAPIAVEQSTDPALGSSDAVTHQTRPRELAPPLPAVVTIDPSGLAERATQESVGRRPWSAAPTAALGTSSERLFSVTDTVTDGKPLPRAPTAKVDEAPVDPAAVAWAPALLPEGASPWSEVVHARPARSKFTGFPGELPELGPDDVIESTAPHAASHALPHSIVRGSEPPGPLLGTSTPAATLLSVRPASPPSGPLLTPARRMAIAAGATLLVLGLVAQWSRDHSAPIEALDGLVVTAINEVTLDAQPSGTTVISEADGRVLGTTPMRFVVPQAADAAVILARPGFEPQRLVLPDRGGIVAVLTPVATAGCELVVEAQPEGGLEGVGAGSGEIGRGPRYTIPGAAVVRSKSAGAVGARIVRCPEAPREAPVRLRFGAAHQPATVRITHPAGATASIDGTEVGVVPAARAVASAFARVRITDASGAVTERWIPSRADVEVQMPTPATAVTRAEAPAPAVVDPTPIAVATSVAGVRSSEPRRDAARGKAEALSLLREGTELLQAGHPETARTRLQACLRADPTAAACHRGLAEVFRREDSATEARAHYQRYLELAPDAPDAALVRSLVRQLE